MSDTTAGTGPTAMDMWRLQAWLVITDGFMRFGGANVCTILRSAGTSNRR